MARYLKRGASGNSSVGTDTATAGAQQVTQKQQQQQTQQPQRQQQQQQHKQQQPVEVVILSDEEEDEWQENKLQIAKQGPAAQQVPAMNGKKRTAEAQAHHPTSLQEQKQQPQEQKQVQPASKRQRQEPQNAQAEQVQQGTRSGTVQQGTNGGTPEPAETVPQQPQAAIQPHTRSGTPGPAATVLAEPGAMSTGAGASSSSPGSAGELDEDLDAQLGFDVMVDNNTGTAAGDQPVYSKGQRPSAGASPVGAVATQPAHLPATATAGAGPAMDGVAHVVRATGSAASVEKLRELGFSDKQAQKALRAAGGDVSRAIEFALAGV
jgi:hypothetical protein